MSTLRASLAALLATVIVVVPGIVSQTLPIDFSSQKPNNGWSVAASIADPAQPRATAHPARLVNLSSRAVARDTANPLIAGAAIAGTGSLPMLVRAVGPGLKSYGVANNLSDPALELFRGTTSAARTTVFSTGASTASNYVGAFPLVSGSTSDAAMLGQAAAGTLTLFIRLPWAWLRGSTRVRVAASGVMPHA